MVCLSKFGDDVAKFNSFFVLVRSLVISHFQLDSCHSRVVQMA